jgi:predicted dehydrogenase
LQAGKHVYVEKPLALNRAELMAVREALEQAEGCQLMVGFNRRFSPLAIKMHALLAERSQPLGVIYTVNAGAIPADHWTQDLVVGGGRIIGEGCHFIDLIRYLVGQPIVGLEARMMGNTPGVAVRQDKMMITLEFADGSIGTVHYLANGSKSYPKERVEVFNQDRVLVLDNFKALKGYGWSGFRGIKLPRQDKGHKAEVHAFVERVIQGRELLIPWPVLEEVTLATFAAVERADQAPRPLERANRAADE